MAAPEMTALLKRSKRSVAVSVKSECSKQHDSQKLTDLLDFLLNPEKPLDEYETLDWLRWLISGGSTFEEFSKTVRQYDNAVTCGLVWTANFVAYRCRTCGVSPCMSLCADCFQAGNHEGHDYNMFRSQAGGACDCGEVSVMNPAGFCPRHGPDRQQTQPRPPGDLLAVAETMMPRIFLRLIYHLRDNSKPEMMDTYLLAMQDAEQFLTFLHSLSDMGAAMRHVMAAALTSKEMYTTLVNQHTATANLAEASNSFYSKSQRDYEAAVSSLQYPRGFDELEDMPGLNQKLVHRTFLEELVFWTVKFEFPQKIVTLLLSLLPDLKYKEEFTRAFIQHYSRISRVLVNALDRQTVANRVVHISVQLFSNESLACQMVREYNLLYILIVSLNNMLEQILTESTLQDAHQNFHMVVDCSNESMKEHCYWPIISDLINLLSHADIAYKFVSDSKLVIMWLELLSYFQGMNLNTRELHQHVEFEPDTYYAAFSAELEISASPMWSLISHLKKQDTFYVTKHMISACQDTLQDWFDAISCKESTNPNPLQLTFHLPLHRYLATFMVQAVQHQGQDLVSVIPPERMLKCLLIHLLQIQVATSEIYANMWVRNGLQIKGQAMTYVQCHFCYSMVDADIFLMQVCACRLDPDYFVQTVLERFHVSDWLSFSAEGGSRSYKMEKDQELAMVEGALQFLTMLLHVRTYLGMEEGELARLEMASLLFVADRQHSQLMDLMPEKSGMTGHGKELFEPTLRDISHYKAPMFEPGGGLQQGTYVPKDELWEKEFDPVHVLLRAVYKNDFQSAMDRYSEFLRKKGRLKGKGQPWPPFKAPGAVLDCYKAMYRILHCKTMHALIFTILQKVLKDPSLPESLSFYGVHLLELAITIPNPDTTRRAKPSPANVPDRNYKEWFSGNDVFENLRETVRNVEVSLSHMATQPEDAMSLGVDTSLEEMFQLAPSALAGASGPITAAHSGQIPTFLTSLTTTTTGPAPSLLSIRPTTSQALPPKYEARGVSTDTPRTEKVVVNESLLTILFKLHSKLAGKSNAYVPPSVLGQSSTGSGESSGSGEFYVRRVLDQLCRVSRDCARAVEDVYQGQRPKDTGSPKKGKAMDPDTRRRKARERQQKLMEEFASKQKAFMEQAMDTEDSPPMGTSQSTDSMDSEGPQSAMDEEAELYDCVICNQSTPSTAERTIGLVVFLQASSVLGHRPQTDTQKILQLGDKTRQRITTCSRVQTKRLETLFKHFEESSCQTSVNIGWEGGVLVQTCGHYLHLDCHTSYVASLLGQGSQNNILVTKGEYSCPLCVQLSNSVIPILPEENKYTLTRPVSPDPRQMALEIADMMVKRPITPRSPLVTKAMGSMMEDLTNATYGMFKTYTSSQTSESVLLFVCSVARTNLEVELLQRNNKLASPLSSPRKHCFLPLLHVLSMHSKILTTKPYTDLWSHITGVSCSESTTSVSLYHKEVPLLLKDPASLLIQIILTLPSTIETGHYDYLVHVVFNIVFIQSLCVITCKFTEEEREAWKRSRHDAFTTLEGMLSHVITRLSTSLLYEKEETDLLAELCEPFLRVAALVKFHLFAEEFPKQEGLTDFQYLCAYLRLNVSSPGKVIEPSKVMSAAQCVRWTVEEPHTLTRAWCTDLVHFVNKNPQDGKSLLTVNKRWFGPRLILLPDQYYKIFQAYRKKTCPVCSNMPKDPCVCLVCGMFLCFRGSCCKQQHLYECVQCGAGTGIFLLINSSIIVVIRGPRAALWGSVYLDEYGEEDKDLKRGKPLYLSNDRYSLLQNQWITHSFDHACKRWIWHQDRL
ncbi:UBR3-like protein [Mya arenaria]|uniref:E3 ubiquitin-protein ligase n=1 Tax=Mya arenaria TaxID=6604 RepID=A0ABY7DAS3_MYAAR|nr:UBR3-like protein [Mya arenaria]